MVTIAFSIILLILAVFVLEIFRNQRKLLHRLDQLVEHQRNPGAGPFVSTDPD
jgi:hypothetical protein